MSFDFTKYGFTFKCDNNGIKVWYLKLEDNSFIDLTELEGVVSIDIISTSSDYPLVVCSRYECKNYQDVEFLLFNGRIGYVFKS